jgi:2-oxoglutarate ferredoxin oxidoreductase subunit alpha
VREALDVLERQGCPADYLRICGFPFSAAVDAFVAAHVFTFVVEQNRDAQLRSLLLLESGVTKDKLRSVLVYGGFPLSSRHVVEGILSQLPATSPGKA